MCEKNYDDVAFMVETFGEDQRSGLKVSLSGSYLNFGSVLVALMEEDRKIYKLIKGALMVFETKPPDIVLKSLIKTSASVKLVSYKGNLHIKTRGGVVATTLMLSMICKEENFLNVFKAVINAYEIINSDLLDSQQDEINDLIKDFSR